MGTPVVVVMGVTGCGKSTIGRLLAERLDVPYEEGDDLHPAANIAKMESGQPLDDEDRRPWLDRVAAWIADHADGGVISCSALKRRYRDRLREGDAGVRFLHVDVDRDEILRRVTERRGHFMPASLVDSQFAALERLGPDEVGTAVDGTAPPDAVVSAALRLLSLG